jgi:SWI/SNF-related matrix-associated actin-dependent regulator of chromatin subfamily A3
MFRRFIANPFKEFERREVAVQRLVTLIDSLCIRRTKARLNLPEAQDTRKYLPFSDVERNQYDKAVYDMGRSLKQRVGSSKSMQDFGLFQIKLQLRILCNHGTYQSPFAWKQNAWRDMSEFALTSMMATGEVVCSVCDDIIPVTSAPNIYRMYGEQCRHAICDLCSGQSRGEDKENESIELKCPVCSQSESHRVTEGRSSARKISNEDYFQPDGRSTKMTCLVNDLTENLSEKKRQ